MFKRLRGHLAGATFGLAMGLVAASYANVTSQLPSTRGPIDPATATFDLIAALNNQLTNYIAISSDSSELGELQISGPNSNTWASNGTVATSVTSLGPAGAHTTVQTWLVVFDTNGFKRFIPAF